MASHNGHGNLGDIIVKGNGAHGGEGLGVYQVRVVRVVSIGVFLFFTVIRVTLVSVTVGSISPWSLLEVGFWASLVVFWAYARLIICVACEMGV
jgi:hypothetical protein